MRVTLPDQREKRLKIVHCAVRVGSCIRFVGNDPHDDAGMVFVAGHKVAEHLPVVLMRADGLIGVDCISVV